MLLVTGPNMGGKSTILRQNCLAAILAQLGCFVPATSFTLTPVDRIFTRLGSSDRILEGKSTFYVEMEETKTMLRHATFASLAVVDELGRGTSTYDGYSLAHSVMSYMLRRINCRCMFATHYHMLLRDFEKHPKVQCCHMAYKPKPGTEIDIEFLYKFVQGHCPQSFGFNVARLAGIDAKIVEVAAVKSEMFMR